MDEKKKKQSLEYKLMSDPNTKDKAPLILAKKINDLEEKIDNIKISESNLEPITKKLQELSEEVKKKSIQSVSISPELKRELKGEPGKSIKGDPGKDSKVPGPRGKAGKSPSVLEVALKASRMAVDELKPTIPDITQLEKRLPVLGESIRNSLELLQGDERLDASAIKGLEEYKSETTRLIGGASGLRTYVDEDKYGLLRSINYKAGTNMTLTYSKINGLDTITFNADGGAEADTLQTVTTRGATTTKAIKSDISVTGGNTKIDDDGIDFKVGANKVMRFQNYALDYGFEFWGNDGLVEHKIMSLDHNAGVQMYHDLDVDGNITGTNLSGTNTGDQDLSGYLTSATAGTTYAKLDGTNQPFTGDITINKAGPKLSLTHSTTGETTSLYYAGGNSIFNMPDGYLRVQAEGLRVEDSSAPFLRTYVSGTVGAVLQTGASGNSFFGFDGGDFSFREVIGTAAGNATADIIRITETANDLFLQPNGIGDVYLPVDNLKLYQGAGNDYSQYFDGTNQNFELTSGSFVFNGGKVGIGTTAPLTNVQISGVPDNDIYGNLRIADTSTLGIDRGGSITFTGYYTGTTLISSWAKIGGLKETATDGQYGGYLSFQTRPNGGVLTEGMRLTSTGNVGIGTTDPSDVLHIASNKGTNYLRVNDTRSTTLDSAGIMFGTGADSSYGKSLIAHQETGTDPFNGRGDLIFAVDSNNDAAGATLADEKMRITSAGKVGIGTASPSRKLQIDGTGNTYFGITKTDATTGAWLIGSESGYNSMYSWTTQGGNSPKAFRLVMGATTALDVDTSANIKLKNDNQKLYFGAGDDASISYDGTDFIINTKEVGGGTIKINGVSAWSGTFTNGDGATVTVTDGLITSVV